MAQTRIATCSTACGSSRAATGCPFPGSRSAPDRRAARCGRRHRRLDVVRDVEEILEGAAEIRHRPRRGHHRSGRSNNSALAGAGFRAGVRHPGDSITAIVMACSTSRASIRPDHLHAQPGGDLRHLRGVHPRQLLMLPLAGGHQGRKTAAARAALGADAGDPAVLRGRLVAINNSIFGVTLMLVFG